LRQLTQALRELLQLIEPTADSGSEAHKARFRELTEQIDELGAALPPNERSLKHYVKQHSYPKALAHLEEV
jgi:hypothetical protein